jgi:hypothetical protein
MAEVTIPLNTQTCRHLHCIRFHDNQHLVWDLSGFTRLSTLRVDWLYENFTPLYAMEDSNIVPFVNVESPIKELDIRGVRYPSPMILQGFTAPLQHLVTLKLESLRTWCGLCHTCAPVRFPSPNPTGLLYEGGLGLSVGSIDDTKSVWCVTNVLSRSIMHAHCFL